MGFTVFSTMAKLLSTDGTYGNISPSTMVLDLIGSALGCKLNSLSMEKGKISLTATTPHNKQLTHLGIFRNKKRTHNTANINQPAVMLIFKSFKKTSPILTFPPPGQSSYELLRLPPVSA